MSNKVLLQSSYGAAILMHRDFVWHRKFMGPRWQKKIEVPTNCVSHSLGNGKDYLNVVC